MRLQPSAMKSPSSFHLGKERKCLNFFLRNINGRGISKHKGFDARISCSQAFASVAMTS